MFTFYVVNKKYGDFIETKTKDQLLETYKNLKERDIHLIDINLQFKDSDIVVRNNIIIIKLYYLRCLITEDRVMISSQIENNISQAQLTKLKTEILNNIKESENFAISSLEAIFEHIKVYFDETVKLTVLQISKYRQKIENNIDGYEVFLSKEFLQFYNNMSSYVSRITDIKDLFDDLNELEDDELLEFSISKINNEEKIKESITNVKDLFGIYEAHFDENFNDITRQLGIINQMFEISQLYISHKRNNIAEFDVKMQMFFGSTLIGSLLFSSFGMNLKNGFEESEISFGIIWLFTIILTLIIFLILHLIYKNQIK